MRSCLPFLLCWLGMEQCEAGEGLEAGEAWSMTSTLPHLAQHSSEIWLHLQTAHNYALTPSPGYDSAVRAGTFITH